MLVRVREKEGGGYKVSTYSSAGDGEMRETDSLQQALDWQAHFSRFGKFPPAPEPVVESAAPEPVQEPEVKASKAKGRKK